MKSRTHQMDKASIRPYAQGIAAILCLLLILVSLAVLSTNLRPVSAISDQRSKTPTVTVTVTNTPTPTPTNTPTPTPTNTPMPTPTPTNAPLPTLTATATRIVRVAVTATAKVGATSTPTGAAAALLTPTADSFQSPTVPSGRPTSTTTGSGNGGGPPTQSVSGNIILSTFAPFIIGALIFTGATGALLLALVLLRKRIMPPPLAPKLPPSGAQPWKRTRSDSLHAIPTINDNALPVARGNHMLGGNPVLAPTANFMSNTLNGAFPPPQAAPLSNASSGFPQPQPTMFPHSPNGFPPGTPVNADDQHFQGSTAHRPPISNVLTIDKPNSPYSLGSPEPVTEQMKHVKKLGTRLVKLDKQESTGPQLTTS